MRHGGQILVDQLAAQGVTRVFSVPGESFLAALDGLHDSGIQNIVCRQEGGAAMMAEAHGKMTNTPGVLFVTRGPGATNASAGIHIAKQDSTPMVVFVGQIARNHRDREAFQEVDYRAVFGPLAKWATEVDQIKRLPEYISHAFHLATSGRPGPVVLALPEDMLSAMADVADLPAPSPQPFAISPEQVSAITDALATAKRPLVLAGGPNWSAQAAADLAQFAEGWDIPVAVSFRRQDRIDNDHPNFVGDLGVGMNPKLGQMLTQADTILVLGARLGDTTTNGYELLDPTHPGPRILHVHPDPAELGRVFHPTLAIPARADQMLTRLAQTTGKGAWADWTKTARANYEAWQTPVATPGAVKLEEVVTWLSANLPQDSIVTNGAGNYAAFLHRYYRFRQHGTQLAPTSGSMGYGFPAAIAASLQNPDRTVVCMAGDGCFQMTCNEASTAVQHGAKPIVIVANNGRYGTIRMHQERHYPGRTSGTDLANPDFAALARAYGGHGETVTDQADFSAAFARAQSANTLAIIELRLDPDMLTPGQSLSQLQGKTG
ncbi:thiamine pyrophosphate-binding protein [Pseudorhodobacter aquimaris]|uniref:thiamine pyrophosphate-binding protein n=1 Tax=Pseudorhodobacter aquimaris TaxID=687412 RepID=UPI00067E5D52|nr:thiamine pyrophosphate-binding protein [Pseudorhodobacter aquimaris]